ncbi:MAG: endolytic transglycosylase MltG [Paracoccaceae bacterium]|nr:endolytic transglycosylase MltG [Paracoccaceae bacterium]
MRHVASNAFNLVILALVLVAGVLAWGRHEFHRSGPLAADSVFIIEKGESLYAVADRLESDGIISNAAVFRIGARFLRLEEALKYGEYPLAARSTMKAVLERLTSGRGVFYWVTVPEGFTVHQVLARIADVDELTGEVNMSPAEGSLAPDTYAVSKGDSRQSVIDRMRMAQSAILEDAWEGRAANLPLDSPEEALILASIVERETGVESERSEVAAVFVNRLRRGWKLQSDPTVIYGLTGGQSSLGRGLRESELASDTPYNTYIISGLPPTPIANPGRASIEATLRPADSDNMFFVADGTGGHVFSATLAEHNRNVARWRRMERERQEQ